MTTEAVTDVLIVGAGPTGLTAACEALRHGLRTRIIEKRGARAALSKALVVHARTMEVFEQLGAAAAVLRAGQPFRALHVTAGPGLAPVRVDLLARRWGDTRYPFWLSAPQYAVEQALEARLGELGGAVEWHTELTALHDDGASVRATLRSADGGAHTHRATWLLACDGGRSDARTLAGLALRRSGLGVTFALVDAHVAAPDALPEAEGHAVLAREGALLVVPMPEARCWRLIAQVPAGFEPSSLDAWRALLRERFARPIALERLGWSSRFDLTSGVAERFRRGRVFLLGDAAHVHSPVGGQGLNTGAQDAHNLVWKLALARRPQLTDDARARLLDSYERERRPSALRMVRGTSVATHALTVTSPLAQRLRGLAASALLRRPAVQDQLARPVGMLDLRSDGLSRLANPTLDDGARLHDRLDPLRPTRLRFRGRTTLVRPDRLEAPSDWLSEALAVAVEVRA